MSPLATFAIGVGGLVLVTVSVGVALGGAAGGWLVAGLWHLGLAAAGLVVARRWPPHLRVLPLVFALPGLVYLALAARA